MAFSLPDRWVWDAWYAQDGAATHMFFLNAPKSIGNPDQRHFYAQIGHAVSHDLETWDEVGCAISPALGPAWDDLATWTGSVVLRPDGKWMMFYTGISRAERGHVQRIGAAWSDDLMQWTRVDAGPLLAADPNHYETLSNSDAVDEAFRDPFVFPDPNGDGWHMYFTARRPTGPMDGRGVIGHATSPDLEVWHIQPPIWTGDLYGELEVPDLFEHEGRWYLLFSTSARMIADSHQSRRGMPRETGTHYLVSETGPLGPWHHPAPKFLWGDGLGTHYVARHVKMPSGDHALIAFNNNDAKGRFQGTLTDPRPMHIKPDGQLRMAANMTTRDNIRKKA